MKRALILATGTYADSRITPLKSPVPDAERLRLLLTRKDVGPYEVIMLSDAGAMAQRVAIERYFQSADPDDTLLLFISGHGDKDADGDLYFLAQDTERDLLSSTAIGAHFVSRQAARSRAKQKVLLIDTCYSGAFAKGHVFKSGSTAITAEDFGGEVSDGRGTAIITAASSTQLASEAAAEGRMQSRFTRHLIEGIETGSADVNGTGNITLDELFDYVRAALGREGPGQEPKRLNAIDGDMVIARNPVPRAVPLAPALLKRVASRSWETRASSCIVLAEIVRRGDQQRDPALAALRALAADPDDRVKRRAVAELGQVGETSAAPPPAPKPAPAPSPDPTPAPSDAQGGGTSRQGLLSMLAGTDEPTTDDPAPKPKLDTVSKIFIGVFAALFIALVIVMLPGDDGGDMADTGSSSSTSSSTGGDPPPPQTSKFGTGGDEYAAYIAYSGAYPTLATDCNLGDGYRTANACFTLGKKFENGEGETADFAIATSLYEKACFYGEAEACAYASFRIRTDNPVRSYNLASAACTQNEDRGCDYLGYNYENGIGTDLNLYSARDTYERACGLGSASGCASRDRLNASMGVTTTP